MKKWLWSSLVLFISCLPLTATGDISLSFKAGGYQYTGQYKEFYGKSRFAFGGVMAYELLRFYRSNLILEWGFDFEGRSREVVLEHIAGKYIFERTLSRSGHALRLRYEYNFSKDGFSLAAGLARDFERETIAGESFRQSVWRPVVSLLYEMNLSQKGRQRLFFGLDAKFNVEGSLETGLVAGLKMNFNLFRKYEG
jgi:hypothetical protein